MKATENLQRQLGIGLDLLLLRHRLRDPEKGSLVAVSESIYAFIQTGSVTFTRKFNLRGDDRRGDQEAILSERMQSLKQLRHEALEEILEQIDIGQLTEDARLTGIRVNEASLRYLSDS